MVRLPPLASEGFTLLEMLLVIFVIAVICGAATLTLAHWGEGITGEVAIEKFRYIDAVARHVARRSGHSVWLRFNTEQQEFQASFSEEGKQPLARCRLGKGTYVDRVWTSGVRDPGLSSAIVNRNGLSPTYALRIRTDEHGYRWLCFAGLSGADSTYAVDASDHLLDRTGTYEDKNWKAQAFSGGSTFEQQLGTMLTDGGAP